MSRRSPHPEFDAPLDGLTRDQVDARIAYWTIRLDLAGNAMMRKAYQRRLVWLEKERARLFGVPAKGRRARQAG